MGSVVRSREKSLGRLVAPRIVLVSRTELHREVGRDEGVRLLVDSRGLSLAPGELAIVVVLSLNHWETAAALLVATLDVVTRLI